MTIKSKKAGGAGILDKPYAIEKWWHRLLRILGYGITLLVLAVSLAIYVEEADYFTYSYSFEPGYASAAGEEFDCHAYQSLKSISCGEFSDGEAFIKHYLSVRGEDKLKDGNRTVNQFFADLREKGNKNVELAVSLIGDKKYKYRREKHWDKSKLVTAVLSAAGVTLASFVALMLLYKVILFVVHGHTRVRRDRPCGR